MTKHKCPDCGWEPDKDAEYPEDQVIEHYEEEHGTY
jgi:predicted small metal-binding protein